MSADADPVAVSSGIEVTAGVLTVAVAAGVVRPSTLCLVGSIGPAAWFRIGRLVPPAPTIVGLLSSSAFAAQVIPFVSRSPSVPPATA